MFNTHKISCISVHSYYKTVIAADNTLAVAGRLDSIVDTVVVAAADVGDKEEDTADNTADGYDAAVVVADL